MKKIHLNQLQNAEHLAFLSDISTLLENVDIEVLTDLKAQLSTSVKNEELAQKEIVKSEHTLTLSELDRKRDDLYRGLVHHLKAQHYSPLDDNRKAAEKVMIVLDTYGNILHHNYQKETTEIQNLIADLKSDMYVLEVSKIGLTEWVNWLQTANDDFNETYVSRRDEYASRPDYNLKAIRKESDAVFKKVQEVVGALQVLQPSESLTEFVTKANASIDKWKEIVALRKGRQHSNKEEK